MSTPAPTSRLRMDDRLDLVVPAAHKRALFDLASRRGTTPSKLLRAHIRALIADEA